MVLERLIAFMVVIACASCGAATPSPAQPKADSASPSEEATKMQVTIQTSAAVARPLHNRGSPTSESAAILRTIEAMGLTLEPMHPGTKDPILQSFFIVEVPNQEIAQQLIDRLQQLEGIGAAYVKPPDEMP